MATKGLEVRVTSGQLWYDKTLVRKVLRSAGAEIAATTRKMIRSSIGAGRWYPARRAGKYRPAHGAYRASAPGQVPVNVTSVLRQSIKIKMLRSGEGVAIRDHAFYAKFLETGARGGQFKRKGAHRKGSLGVGPRRLLPRPFLSKAIADRAPSITARVKIALRDGLKLVRMKP